MRASAVVVDGSARGSDVLPTGLVPVPSDQMTATVRVTTVVSSVAASVPSVAHEGRKGEDESNEIYEKKAMSASDSSTTSCSSSFWPSCTSSFSCNSVRDTGGSNSKKDGVDDAVVEAPPQGGEEEDEQDGEAYVVPTPAPTQQLIILGVILLSEAMSASALFPFVGLYVSHLTDLTVNESGNYAGLVVGLFTFGQVVSGSVWGFLSDRYGRKVPMVIGLSAGAVACILFGVAPNFIFCCVFRFIHGMFNGNVMIAKTIIADITDPTNEAKGFAVLSLTWGMGTLIGPAMGGFLYDADKKDYMGWAGISHDGFLAGHPAFLPSLFLSLYAMCATVMCVFLLEESNPNAQSIFTVLPRGLQVKLAGCCSCLSPLVETTERSGSHGAVDARGRVGGAAADVTVTAVPMEEAGGAPVGTPPTAGRDEEEEEEDGAKGAATAVTGTTEARPAPASAIGYMTAFKDSLIRRVIISGVSLGVTDTAYEETLPLWAIATISVGGLALDSDEIAVIIITYSVPTVLANLVFDRVCNVFRDQLQLFRVSSWGMVVLTLLVPLGSKIGHRKGFWYVIIVGVFRQVFLSWAYGLAAMFTARCAPPGAVGALFGITQTVSCLARCVIPIVITRVFAWSISEHRATRPFPTNYYFVFVLCSVVSVFSLVLTYFIHFRPASHGRVVASPSSSPTTAPRRKGVDSRVDSEQGAVGENHRCRCRRRHCRSDACAAHSCHAVVRGDSRAETSSAADGDDSDSDVDSVRSERSAMRGMTRTSLATGATALNASFAQGTANAVGKLRLCEHDAQPMPVRRRGLSRQHRASSLDSRGDVCHHHRHRHCRHCGRRCVSEKRSLPLRERRCNREEPRVADTLTEGASPT